MEKQRHVSTTSDNCFAFRLTEGRSALNMVEAACEWKADDIQMVRGLIMHGLPQPLGRSCKFNAAFYFNLFMSHVKAAFDKPLWF